MEWLTEPERAAWQGLVAVFTGLDQALDQQLQREAGISHATYGVLAALSSSPEGRHMSDLAGVSGYSQSRLSHAVARLEQGGLVHRVACPSDGRAVHAVLSDRGQHLIEHAAPGHVAAVRALVFERLTAEQTATLTEILGVVARSLTAHGVVLPFSAAGHEADDDEPATSRRAAAPATAPARRGVR